MRVFTCPVLSHVGPVLLQILTECQKADVLCDGFLLDKLVHLIIGLNW
jgi:hypothetical protein